MPRERHGMAPRDDQVRPELQLFGAPRREGERHHRIERGLEEHLGHPERIEAVSLEIVDQRPEDFRRGLRPNGKSKPNLHALMSQDEGSGRNTCSLSAEEDPKA